MPVIQEKRREYPAGADMCEATPTVFIVDDDDAMRESLHLLIKSANLKAQTYASAEAFLEAYDPTVPGCLILDIRMPSMSGLDLQRVLAARRIHLPIIMVTGYGDIPIATQAMKDGAIDFLEKPYDPAVLLERVHEANERDRRVRHERANRGELAERLASLTPRERGVMDMLVAGKTVKAIALELGLSPKTIQVHRARILEKTQSDSVPHLIWLAVETGKSRR